MTKIFFAMQRVSGIYFLACSKNFFQGKLTDKNSKYFQLLIFKYFTLKNFENMK